MSDPVPLSPVPLSPVPLSPVPLSPVPAVSESDKDRDFTPSATGRRSGRHHRPDDTAAVVTRVDHTDARAGTAALPWVPLQTRLRSPTGVDPWAGPDVPQSDPGPAPTGPLDRDPLDRDRLDPGQLATGPLDPVPLDSDLMNTNRLDPDPLDPGPPHEDALDADPAEGGAVAVRARRFGHRWGRYAELWVPEPLRDARVDPGRRGALVLILVATLAAVITAIGVWRDRPEPRPVQTSAVAVVGSGSATTNDALPTVASGGMITAPPLGSGTGAPTVDNPAPATEIVVSVTGLVSRPGVVTLPGGARVADAIAAAGGADPDADLTGVNLAAHLADGDAVVLGPAAGGSGAASSVSGAGTTSTAGGKAGAPSAAAALVDLNTADEATLDTLPGVGPVMAKNIVAWREANGRFATVDQLQEISGIGPARYAQLAGLVTVS